MRKNRLNVSYYSLGGTPCSECGLPATRAEPDTGLTYHVDTKKAPCRSKLPQPQKKVES